MRLRLALVIFSLWSFVPASAQSQPPARIFDEKGRPIGEIKRNPTGGYDLYDQNSRRQGYGKEYSNGTIRFYGNDGRPLFQIRPDSRVIQERGQR